jgi:hypothetical protein
MHLSKKFLLLLSLLPAAFLICSDNPLNQDVKKSNVSIKLVADAKSDFSAVASTAEVKVSAEGMPTLTQPLTVTSDGISGTITGIIAGPNRKFEVFVYDEANKLCYYGSAIGEVTVGGTANISLTLYRTNGEGNAIINGTIQPSNIPPTVSMTSPANNAQVTLGSAIQLAATAADADGSVSSVAFYSGTTLLSTDNTSPYSYNYTPTATGTYSLSAVATDNAGASATSAAVAVTVNPASLVSYKINCGGSAVSPFAADAYYSGGSTSSTTSTITISGITNPAPAAVYQKERYGAVTYTFPSLVSGASYNVRLHFAELYWTASAKRRFNVAINGSQVLSNFDIYATAGAAKKAVLREFTATANTNSQIVISFTNVTDNASICGIEILPAVVIPVITGPSSRSTCQGVPAVLSVTATGGSGFTYQWYSGAVGSGTAISGATSASYSTSTPGSYYCVVANSSGGSATSSAASVTVAVSPSISGPSNQSICSGSSATLSVSASGGSAFTYQWYSGAIGSGTAISGATSASYTTATPGSYYCVVTNSNGCSTSSSAAAVTVIAAPSISGPTNQSICSGASATLSVSASGATAYQWYTASGSAISGATSYAYTTTTAGSYYCRVTNTYGCSANSATATVTIGTPPSISGPTNQTTCAGSSATLSVSASGATAYQWYTSGGSAISGATSASYSTGTAGSYYCRVTNAYGCSANSNTATLTVTALPVIATQPVSTTAPLGSWGGFSVYPEGDLSNYTYLWYFNGQPASSVVPDYIMGAGTGYMIYIQAAPATTGNWYCVVTATSTGCTRQTNTVTFSVDQMVVITSQPSSATICAGASAMFGVTATGGTGLTYQWYTGAGSAISGATSSMYVTATPGSYYCRVSNIQGSSVNSNMATLTVNPIPVIDYQPESSSAPLGSYGGFAIYPAGDYLNDYTYQWYFNGQIATSSPAAPYIMGDGKGYMIYIMADPATTGNWHCIVTVKSTGCTRQSNTATFSVSP